jgi:eukaryotic-like serine/threonine-protein kinase
MTQPVLTALHDRYRIERELGRGGMATVYLAEDLKHHREVAIKVLEADLATSLGPERFLKEIELTAGLQHPHIVPLFDSGSADGALYYVMPYVEGESLRAKLDREKQLSMDEAMRIATEAADALDYAHRHGVVHRDIKPDNILLHDGHALVADFGISIALEQAGAQRLTATGVSLGTPQYMSPEQLSGDRAVDARTDIFSLGAVTYEMLGGFSPHAAPTAAATAARVLVDTPTRLTMLRPSVPANVERAVMRALAKAPADRFASAADFAAALHGADEAAARTRATSHVARWIALGLVLAVVVPAAALLFSRSRAGAAPISTGRVTHLTRDPGLELDPALSPDGKSIAYAAGPAGDMRIYVRQLAGGHAVQVAASLVDNQRWPQWSPDGTKLVFQVGHAEREADSTMPPNALYVVPALGGVPRKLFSDTASDISPSWSPDGSRIAFSRGDGVYGRALYVIDANGSSPPQFVATASMPTAPRWSPDGTMLAYVTDNPRFALGTAHLGNSATSSIWIVTLADGRTHRVTPGTWLEVSPVWSPDGRELFYISNKNGSRDVFRIAIARNGDSRGAPEQMTSGLNAHGIDLSRDGKTLAYSVFNPYAHVWSVPIPPSGSTTIANATQVTTGDETDEGFALSPDGRWLAYDSDRSGNGDVWKIPSTGGEPMQLTTDPHGDYVQDWSSDGAEIAFHSFRTGHRQVFVMNADGGNVQQVTNLPNDAANPDFAPDGNTIAFDYSYGVSGQIFLVSRARRGEAWGTPRQLTTRGGTDPQWSPDGKWIAYVQDGIHVVSPDGTGDKVVIPRTRGTNGLDPQFAYWSADGRFLYYKAYDARERSSIWVAPVSGGAPRLIIRFDDPARPSGRREIATDGKRMFFSLAQQEADVWLVEIKGR